MIRKVSLQDINPIVEVADAHRVEVVGLQKELRWTLLKHDKARRSPTTMGTRICALGIGKLFLSEQRFSTVIAVNLPVRNRTRRAANFHQPWRS